MAAPTTQKTWRVSLTVEGREIGVFDKKTGGRTGSAALSYTPGNMDPQIALPGGTQVVEALTLTRYYDLVRDHDNLMPFLLAQAGKGTAVAKQRPLDKDGNAHGRTIVTTGILSYVSDPDTDSESDTAAMLTVEITPNGPKVMA